MTAVRQTDPDTGKRHDDRKDGTRYTDRGPGAAAGNLTRDPELRYTPAGRAIASLRLADTERVQAKGGSGWTDGPTSFYDVMVWGDQAERACGHLRQGDRVAAVGRWQDQEWTDPEGKERSRLVLVARDLGASLLFVPVEIMRRTRQEGGRS